MSTIATGNKVAFSLGLGGGDVPQRPLVSRATTPANAAPVADTGTLEQIATGKALFCTTLCDVPRQWPSARSHSHHCRDSW